MKIIKSASILDLEDAISDRINYLEMNSSRRIKSSKRRSVKCGAVSDLVEKSGISLEDWVNTFREETNKDPIFDESAKKEFRKWAADKLEDGLEDLIKESRRSKGRRITASDDFNEYVDEVMQTAVSDTATTFDGDVTYTTDTDAIHAVFPYNGNVISLDVPTADLKFDKDNIQDDVMYISKGIMYALDDVDYEDGAVVEEEIVDL